MLQVEKYKANKAQKECQQRKIGKSKNNLLQVKGLRKAKRKRNVGRRNREKKEQHVAS
ncbi:hypothetical protein ACQVPR_23250 [Bacillus cereus]